MTCVIQTLQGASCYRGRRSRRLYKILIFPLLLSFFPLLNFPSSWVSPTQWTWNWANSRRQWRTGKAGVLQSMRLQRLRYGWVTETYYPAVPFLGIYPDKSEWMRLLSCVQLFATPWTVAYQAPPSMGFSRQECWSGLPFPSPRDLPWPRDWTRVSRIVGRPFTVWATWEVKTIIQKDTWTPMFIASLFTIAKTWKPKCPSRDEWVKMWYMYNGILFSHETEWDNALCSNMDGPMLSEES